MKRFLSIILLSLVAIGSSSSDSDAQRRRRRPTTERASGKIAIPCPVPLNDITDCPDTGCGGSLDPNLNRQKNIRTDDQAPVTKTIPDLKELSDPVPGYKIGDTREKLEALGEGDKIRVVAYALVARKGVKESCNCGLTRAKDTDNHIVLVDEAALDEFPSLSARRASRLTAKELQKVKLNILHAREEDSITAEFAPRVRLDHPNLAGAKLQSFIKGAPRDALLVRITGLLMFDSQHSLEGALKRHNNWEIHPVMGLEFCPRDKTCTQDSDENWEDLEDQ